MPVTDKFLLDSANAILLVIDVQERLCAAMDPQTLQRLCANTGTLLQGAEELGVPVIYTEQYSKGLGPTLPELRQWAPAAPVVEKLTFSCCGNPDFLAQIRATGRKQVIVTGMETHVCVLQTVIGLLGEGYVVHVVQDSVMSRSPDNRQTALEAMAQAGAVPTSTESVLFQLLKVAGTESFRKLSKLVK